MLQRIQCTLLSFKKVDVSKALHDVKTKMEGFPSTTPTSLIIYYSGHGN